MRVPIIAGNWKMNTNLSEALKLVNEISAGLTGKVPLEIVVCPPFVSLAAVRDALAGSPVSVGAQNLFYEEKGAYTGEISALMLSGICRYVIIGHSERRQYFHETDEIVSRKIKTALKQGLRPIVCVGENLEQYEAGRTEETVSRQIKGSLSGVDSIENVTIAYEPIWAIGTGKAASGMQANQTIGLIRRLLEQAYGPTPAAGTRILYGGSVTAANMAEFIGQSDIDGGLVGGASLKAPEFLSIIKTTMQVRQLA